MGSERREQSGMASRTPSLHGQGDRGAPSSNMDNTWIALNTYRTTPNLHPHPRKTAFCPHPSPKCPHEVSLEFLRESVTHSSTASPLAPPCSQGGVKTAWLDSLLFGWAASSGALVLPTAFGAQQLPDPGSKCPTAGLGEAGVALSTMVLLRQPPSLLACRSPASPLPLQAQQVCAQTDSRRGTGA